VDESTELLGHNLVAGFLEGNEAGGVGLSAKGGRWYEHDLLRRE